MIIERLDSVVQAEKTANANGRFLEEIEKMPFEKLIESAFTEYTMYVVSSLDRRCPEAKLNEYRQHSNWYRREIHRRFLENPELSAF